MRARLAPVDVALLALLGDRREVVAQLAGAPGEAGEATRGRRRRSLASSSGGGSALGLGGARELLERGVELEPRGLALGMIEQARAAAGPGRSSGADERAAHAARTARCRRARRRGSTSSAARPVHSGIRASATCASRTSTPSLCGRDPRAEVLGGDVLELVRLVEDHRVVLGQHARARIRRAQRAIGEVQVVVDEDQLARFSASRRACVTKQRSKYGQRGPMRASGVVVTSLHSGAASASHSTSERSPVSVCSAQSTSAPARSFGDRARGLGEPAPAHVVRDALEHDRGERPREHRRAAAAGRGARSGPAARGCPVETTTRLPDCSAGTRYASVLPVPVPASTISGRCVRRALARPPRTSRAARRDPRSGGSRARARRPASEQIADHARLREAFSTCPLVPNRRASSASTSLDRDPARGQPDHDVEQQIGGLVDDLRRVAGGQLGGELAALLGDLLEDLRHALVEQRLV